MSDLLMSLPLELQNLVCSYMGSVPNAKLIKDCVEHIVPRNPTTNLIYEDLFFKRYCGIEAKLAFNCGYKFINFATRYNCKLCESGRKCESYYEVDNKYVCEWCYIDTYPNLIDSDAEDEY